MKTLSILFFFLVSVNSFAASKKYSISCKGDDCFTDGWFMQEVGGVYFLNNNCKSGDCENLGWSSVDSKGDTFDVTCLPGGCFYEGWKSVNKTGNKILKDEVKCKLNSCLSYGWTVKTGYDLSGGNVSCINNDCSRFGGTAVWRGKISRTACKNDDCYRYGWNLTIY